jgi:hypothetical protein
MQLNARTRLTFTFECALRIRVLHAGRLDQSGGYCATVLHQKRKLRGTRFARLHTQPSSTNQLPSAHSHTHTHTHRSSPNQLPSAHSLSLSHTHSGSHRSSPNRLPSAHSHTHITHTHHSHTHTHTPRLPTNFLLLTHTHTHTHTARLPTNFLLLTLSLTHTHRSSTNQLPSALHLHYHFWGASAGIARLLKM